MLKSKEQKRPASQAENVIEGLEEKLREKRIIESSLRLTLSKLENTRRASINLLEDLRDEIEVSKKKGEEAENARQQLEKLNSYLFKIREDERKYISRELHDELGQALTAIKMDIASLKLRLDTKRGYKIKIRQISSLVDESIRTVQRLTMELRPPLLDELGLTTAIQWYASEFAGRTSIRLHLNIENIEGLPKEKELVIFRIVQESLTNIARHSKAQNAEITFSQNAKGIILEIRDDGIGISGIEENSFRSYGLLNMKERAKEIGASLIIITKSNNGTKVQLSIPASTS